MVTVTGLAKVVPSGPSCTVPPAGEKPDSAAGGFTEATVIVVSAASAPGGTATVVLRSALMTLPPCAAVINCRPDVPPSPCCIPPTAPPAPQPANADIARNAAIALANLF